MPKKGCAFSIPLAEQLILRRWRTQQTAIAAPHRCETALSRTNGPVAQVVRSPITFENAPSAEQGPLEFRDKCCRPFAHGARGRAPVVGGDARKAMQRLPLPAFARNSKSRSSGSSTAHVTATSVLLQPNCRNWPLFRSLKSSLTCESELSSNPGRTGTTVGKTSGAQMAICSRKD